jgi:hypothetical protein
MTWTLLTKYMSKLAYPSEGLEIDRLRFVYGHLLEEIRD